MAKVNILHVPYKGMAPAIVSVVSGEGQILFASIPSILGHVRAGRVNALGVGNAKRVPSLPDFPTVAESGLPGFEAYAWAGMVGPAGMQRDIVLRLSKEIIAILNQKDVIDRMLADGTVPTPMGPDEFVAYMKSELKKWATW
jgi:tripartite-type tricarboxylate transporter receptor subunit TctC